MYVAMVTRQAEAKRRVEEERQRQVADEAKRNELIEEKRREAEAEKEVRSSQSPFHLLTIRDPPSKSDPASRPSLVHLLRCFRSACSILIVLQLELLLLSWPDRLNQPGSFS